MQRAIVLEQGMSVTPGPAAHDLGTRTVEKQKGHETSFARKAATIVTGIARLVMGHNLTTAGNRVLRQDPAVYFVIGRRCC